MGSLISYLYYKQSVEGPAASKEEAIAASVTQPIPIRHRPTAHDPDLQIDPTPEKL
jgi:hypothetical protein